MIENIRKMWKIPELRRKIIYTFLMLVLFRLISMIPAPGVNYAALKEAMLNGGTINGNLPLMDLVNMMTGSAFNNMTIMAMGITPYINASIIMQLLTIAIPALERLSKEEDGRQKINRITRYVTVVLAALQAIGLVRGIQSQYVESGWTNLALIGISMATGTALAMWIGERITEKGVGNGISLLIMAGILARAPGAINELWNAATSDGGLKMGGTFGVETLLFLVFLFFVVVLGVVFITKGQRRIPTQSAKHVRGRQVYGGNRQYLPLRVNQAGVMPIIFASSLLLFPQFIFAYLATNLSSDASSWWIGFVRGGHNIFSGSRSFTYILLDVILIYFFCYFWTAVTFNPKDMADNLKRSGTFIQGYRPGSSTANYLEKVMLRITYVGASFLAIIAIVPTLITNSLHVGYSLASFFGGTSLLIAVSVVLDLVDKIDAHLVMRNYKGLLEK